MNKNNKTAKAVYDAQIRYYFDSIKNKPVLRLPIYDTGVTTRDGCEVILPPQSCTALWIYEEYELYKWIEIVFVKIVRLQDDKKCYLKYLPSCDANVSNQIGISYTCKCDSITRNIQSDLELCVENCAVGFKKFNFSPYKLVVFISEKELLISGLSSILRFMLKFVYMKTSFTSGPLSPPQVSDQDPSHLSKLLGFRGGCLQACTEVSTWTKFVEIDICSALKNELKQDNNDPNKELSQELLRFEYHLKKPVKMHNIKKEIITKRQLMLENHGMDNFPVEMEHKFAEGPHMLLSDLVLYPCICIFQSLYGSQTCEKYFPNTCIWYSNMNQMFHLNKKLKLLGNVSWDYETCWKVPQIPDESLYKKDRSRYNPSSRAFTRQSDVLDAFESIRLANITPMVVTDVTENLNWDDIPVLAHPEGGNLPKSRIERKCQQLSSIVVEVMKVVEVKAKQNNSSLSPIRIVDFCSGGGHCGILLAYLLPKCQIMLVENKEESLRRAWERVEQLKLTNVLLYQCNMDYFDCQFEIGVALHACGTATDLVLSKCISNNACFITTPCCYGSIQSNHMLNYPRSDVFRESGISLKHYYILSHASDQTHDEKNKKTEQGKLCMRIIDTDRIIHAQENGYHVHLKKIVPHTASPKNHIIVGVSSYT